MKVPDVSQFADSESLKRRDGWPVSLRKDLDKTPKNFTISLSPVLLQRTLQPFIRVTVS